MSLDHLTADDLQSVARGFRDALRAHKEGINRLNVFPVPDGDTGTNMTLTLESVADDLDGVAPTMADTCQSISHASLMGARGNSGVILCQILRGLCASFRDLDDDTGIGPVDFARALTGAATAAYGAVGDPREGTILTVVREAAEAATVAADGGGSLVEVLDAARVGGGISLERTPELLPVLKEAGVVDAGGAGFLLLLDAALLVADGRPLPEADEDDTPLIDPAFTERMAHAHTSGEHDISGLRYEVMYFLEAPDETIPAFKDVWAGIGDSIVVVGGDGLWNCHIHTDDIGASIDAAVEIGRPRKIRVTDLLEELEEERWVREAQAAPADDVSDRASVPVETAVVAVATGDGIRRIFYSSGAQGIVTGGQTMNPSTAQLLEAVDAAPSDDVIILPNNKNIIPVAEQVNAHTSKTVHVVPTRGVAEGFAALVAYDPKAAGADNAAAMTAAAADVVAGEVTQAVRNSSCDVGPISEGDWLGIVRDGIVAVAQSLNDVCEQLLEQMIDDDHEVITIVCGEGSTSASTRHLEVWLQENRPDVQADVLQGGQPLYPYFFGVE